MSRPRMSRSDASPRPSNEVPSRVTSPVTVAFGGNRPVRAMAVTLLPHPDSPTSASTSRGATSKDAWSTASTGPSSVRNRTVSSRTDSSAVIGGFPSDPTLALNLLGEREQHDGDAGKHGHPGPVTEQRLGAGEHDAKRRRRRPGAESEEGRSEERRVGKECRSR